ncbi:hypothetical protein NUW54_g5305 [Trametes sanguinea]|uniref:Uncharacterized protein n=1 Tax=Trametes sanguinea TaxID=158606 RepID=A0ACC1PWQ0_9APHY|nr:hypothetical protein NUW54_g5305 [Trametes sanguinea]
MYAASYPLPSTPSMIKAPTKSLHRFSVLNADCLARIYVEARQLKALRSLSLTCKRIRESCMDVLFERCRVYVAGQGSRRTRKPPPPTLWPHLRQLNYYGSLKDPYPIGERRRPETPPLERFAHMLNAMPRLRGIKVANSEIGSVAWAIFHTILTTPQLRSFETDLPFAPLETFHYCPLVYNKPSYSQLEEMKLLSNTLSKVSGSLVTLVLPAECFSFDTMRHGDWPNLREIRIAGYGRRFCMSDTDLVSVLGHISRLRVLSFDLAVADEDELKPLWPAHTQRATFPWPELESISLTWVHLDETIFSHLPRTCRHLSLRSWPRPYNYYRIRGKLIRGVPWRVNMLSPPVVLKALHECNDLPLEHLELEYRAESDDTALLEFVASTFPHLRKLRLIRYRSESDQERVPVRDIVGHFSSMQALRVLELYLDIEHVTLPHEERPSFDEFCRILDVAIADIASALCSSVVSVRLITAEDSGLARWRYYRPIRAHGKCMSLVLDVVDTEQDYLYHRPSW